MAVDLLMLNEELVVSSNVVFHAVTDDEQLRQWTRVWGYGAPEEAIQQCYAVYSGLLAISKNALRLYFGTIAGESIATVALFFGAGVAAIEHVVTIPQVRRQGIGAAITLMAAQEARARIPCWRSDLFANGIQYLSPYRFSRVLYF